MRSHCRLQSLCGVFAEAGKPGTAPVNNLDRDSYEFISLISEGAYGCVWKARHKESGTVVAIKRMKSASSSSEDLEFAMREVKLLQQCLDHENVVQLYEAYQSINSGRLYLVFEYLPTTLRQLIKESTSGLPVLEVKQITKGLLTALDHLHSNQIMHRDIKPANILITDSADSKLCDFGLARLQEASPDVDFTHYVVTRWYRPVEVLLGDSYNTAVDIWSLGCLFVEMLTGKPLFPGRSQHEQLYLELRALGMMTDRQRELLEADSHFSCFCPPPESSADLLENRLKYLSGEIMDVVRACLHYDPDKRGTAGEILNLAFFQDEDHGRGSAARSRRTADNCEEGNSVGDLLSRLSSVPQVALPDRLSRSSLADSASSSPHASSHADKASATPHADKASASPHATSHADKASATPHASSHADKTSASPHDQLTPTSHCDEARSKSSSSLAMSEGSDHSPVGIPGEGCFQHDIRDPTLQLTDKQKKYMLQPKSQLCRVLRTGVNRHVSGMGFSSRRLSIMDYPMTLSDTDTDSSQPSNRTSAALDATANSSAVAHPSVSLYAGVGVAAEPSSVAPRGRLSFTATASLSKQETKEPNQNSTPLYLPPLRGASSRAMVSSVDASSSSKGTCIKSRMTGTDTRVTGMEAPSRVTFTGCDDPSEAAAAHIPPKLPHGPHPPRLRRSTISFQPEKPIPPVVRSKSRSLSVAQPYSLALLGRQLSSDFGRLNGSPHSQQLRRSSLSQCDGDYLGVGLTTAARQLSSDFGRVNSSPHFQQLRGSSLSQCDVDSLGTGLTTAALQLSSDFGRASVSPHPQQLQRSRHSLCDGDSLRVGLRTQASFPSNQADMHATHISAGAPPRRPSLISLSKSTSSGRTPIVGKHSSMSSG
eukprot:gene4833-34582_t